MRLFVFIEKKKEEAKGTGLASMCRYKYMLCFTELSHLPGTLHSYSNSKLQNHSVGAHLLIYNNLLSFSSFVTVFN
jgi:hypothetical protein